MKEFFFVGGWNYHGNLLNIRSIPRVLASITYIYAQINWFSKEKFKIPIKKSWSQNLYSAYSRTTSYLTTINCSPKPDLAIPDFFASPSSQCCQNWNAHVIPCSKFSSKSTVVITNRTNGFKFEWSVISTGTCTTNSWIPPRFEIGGNVKGDKIWIETKNKNAFKKKFWKNVHQVLKSVEKF